ncbi:Zinc finger BED domain-containing protein DAYSLEEPER [Zea mays]|uniref:Zinc finger BED domain-containing protein DAYSLEEPER n=1 Tax=Zea mays TaxID=4577 RepID=A0A1D6E6X9_MAIZE|nr:Zinc finger BED domain-containing protein DAYSLEEPER [Zea mays]
MSTQIFKFIQLCLDPASSNTHPTRGNGEIYASSDGLLMLSRCPLSLLLASSLITDSFHCY